MRVALLLLLAALSGCRRGDAPSAATPPAGAVTVVIAYGSEKKTWLEEQAKAFAATAPRLKSGSAVRLDARAMGSGESVQAILSGALQPTVYSPASGAYVSLLNDAWLSTAGHTQALCPAGEPIVLSPIVIALWKPMAEALGWPAKPLGWRDLLAVNANAKGWGALGHPEWGRFKLGHTHPEFSNSGLLAVLAEAYAGAKKARGLDAKDLAAPQTRAFVAAVEQTIVHYGKSTGFFADKMLERGPGYLSAAVLYENLVIEAGAKSPQTPVVAIYPTEGTFWSDHPWAVLDAPWVSAEQREAAALFLAFLKAKPAQERALQLGFRPADASIAIGAPIDAAHGADPRQPQALLDVPAAPVLRSLIALWQESKRATDVELVFDKSGSMNGRPMNEAKAGARVFLESLHDRDQASLMFFDSELYPPFGPVSIKEGRQQLLQRVDSAIADGGTALYDATLSAFSRAGARAGKDPGRIHAVVVMTDGKDNKSHLDLSSLRAQLSDESAQVKVFTIAYGSEADPAILASIAEAARGSAVKGSAENIVQVFQDMASFF